MVLASTNVFVVQYASKYGSCQCLSSQRESQLLPSSLGDSARSASGSDQVPFKFLPLHWALEHERLCVCHLRVKSLFSIAL